MPGRRVDRGLQVQPAGSAASKVREQEAELPLVLLVAAGVPQAMTGSPSRSTSVGDSVVRGRVAGRSVDGRPSVSQVIWALVPRQKPSSGMVGALCSQPPDGVAETIVPHRSTTST